VNSTPDKNSTQLQHTAGREYDWM